MNSVEVRNLVLGVGSKDLLSQPMKLSALHWLDSVLRVRNMSTISCPNLFFLRGGRGHLKVNR